MSFPGSSSLGKDEEFFLCGFIVGRAKGKKCAGDQMEGLMPIFGSWSRHSRWCRDRGGVVHGGQAHG